MSNLHTADYITVAMSRFIKDRDRVIHGVALPMPAISIQLDKQLHAENAVYLSIAGGVDAKPSSYDLHSTAATQLREGAITEFTLADIFDLSARGELDIAFLSGAQVDGYGRLNLSAIGPFDKPKIRLPGGAGSAALLPTVKRGILWKTAHDKRGFVDNLDVITAVCNTEIVIMPLGIVTNSLDDLLLCLYAVFPVRKMDEIIENSGFTVVKHEEFKEFPDITVKEKQLLTKIDPDGLRFSEFQ